MEKRYKTTKKHPSGKGYWYSRKKIYNDSQVFRNIQKKELYVGSISEKEFLSQLKKGWIKEKRESKWLIRKNDNWKLLKVEKDYKLDLNEASFHNKKWALEFVFEEAKKRFPEYSKFKQKDYSEIRTIKRLYIDDIHILNGDNIFIWRPGSGWIAEPIVEKELTKKEAFMFAKFYAGKIVSGTVKPDIEKLFEDWENC